MATIKKMGNVEYTFEEEQEEIKEIVEKIKVISILLTGEDLISVKPTPEFVQKLIYKLWEVIPPESLVSEYEEYRVCDNLYIEGGKVVGYLGRDFVDSVFEDFTTEEVFYALFNVILPELFSEYEDEFSRCFDALTNSDYNKGTKMFFNTIDKLIEGRLEIDAEELEKAKESLNKATAFCYLDFIKEFSQIVLDLLWRYIDRENVYSLAFDSVNNEMDSYMEYLEERINSVSNIDEIKYTDRGEIKVVFSSSYDFFKPNFTHLFYELENILDDYTDILKDGIFKKVPIAEMLSREKPVNEEEMVNILTKLIVDSVEDYVNEVYPTNISLEICGLLEEIKREQGGAEMRKDIATVKRR